MSGKGDRVEFAPPVWVDDGGKPLSCVEKIKVLNENLEELRDMAQEALEDAVLMGADEKQIRQALDDLVSSLVNPYGTKHGNDR